MVRIFSLVFFVILVFLTAAGGIFAITSNTVPGEPGYPVKRQFESLNLAIISLIPEYKTTFTMYQSNRRYQEVIILNTQNLDTRKSLEELILQTKDSMSEIQNVKEWQQKVVLINDLIDAIEKYDMGLAGIQEQLISSKLSSDLLKNKPSATPRNIIFTEKGKVGLMPQEDPFSKPETQPSSPNLSFGSDTLLQHEAVQKARQQLKNYLYDLQKQKKLYQNPKTSLRR